MTFLRCRFVSCVPALVVACATPLAGQCAPAWLPGDAVAGVSGAVHCVERWDPDGPGPRTAVYAVGGQFPVAGGVVANGIAAWDPATSTWSSLGGGMAPTFATVKALRALPNGDLIAGGAFVTSGGVTTNGIARWNGSAWQPLGNGLATDIGHEVKALAVLPNGDLLACGSLSIAAGSPAEGVLRWDGVSWSSLGTGVTGDPRTLLVRSNGDVLVGGLLGPVGTSMPTKILRYDGTSWTPFATGAGDLGWHVSSLAEMPNGDIIAGGYFLQLGGVTAQGVARWNGTAWSQVGSGLPADVLALAVDSAGSLLVAADAFPSGVVRWTGASWTLVGGDTDTSTRALAVGPAGEIVVGGDFERIGGEAAAHVGRWDGTAWQALGPSTDGSVYAIARLAGGDLVVGGDFTRIGGVAAARIARQTAAGWVPLGAGFDGPVHALAVLPSGDLVAGGDFGTAGGVPAAFVARWNGSTWAQVGTGTNGSVLALTVGTDGKLLVGGAFHVPANQIVAWDGANWLSYGTGLDASGQRIVRAIQPLPGGQFLIGGSFQSVSGTVAYNVARWTGSAWTDLPWVPTGTVQCMAMEADGDVLIGGAFSFFVGSVRSSGIARWNGTTIEQLGAGPGDDVRALATLPDGSILAAGSLAGGHIVRWNGAAWAPIGDPPVRGTDAEVHALHALPDGSVALGGAFTRTGDQAAVAVGRLTSTCPSSVVAYGNACNGSAGPVTLSNDTAPWVGGVFRSTATGFAPNSLGLWQVGVGAAAVPLPPIFAASAPGCALLTTADVANLLVGVSGGAVTVQQPIPVAPALAGLAFYHQVGQVEFDPATLAITRISASGGLQVTIGSL